MAGQGPTTVVFENGLGDTFGIWSQVFPSVAQHTQAFAYDRAGYGASTASSDPRDTQHIVEELRATLAAAGVLPPYVLVGHSIGGLYTEGFARLHPTEVIAWVSVEGRPADLTQECMAQDVTDCDPPSSETSGYTGAKSAEFEAREAAAQQVRDAPSLRGDLPVRVLMGTSPDRTEPVDGLTIYQALLKRNAAETSNGKLIEAPQSGHYVQTQQPDLVIGAIEGVLR
jgi:pimeloyl-ACP methyl ester carboxylesterase